MEKVAFIELYNLFRSKRQGSWAEQLRDPRQEENESWQEPFLMDISSHCCRGKSTEIFRRKRTTSMSETEATNLEQILIFLPGMTPILHRIIFHLV